MCSLQPLPVPPQRFRSSPPATPRLTPASTPSSSPRASISPSYSPSQPLPRSRPPSTNMGNQRTVQTHNAFPSISSTLSLLEERSSESAKRSGVLVQSEDEADHASVESTIMAHSAVRKSSTEALKTYSIDTKNAKINWWTVYVSKCLTILLTSE